MISFMKGTLVASDSEGALVEVNGIGYRILMSYNALSNLGHPGEEVLVLTYLYVREDALVLYGFTDESERDLFERLITVSGIGPKVALSALSRFTANELISAIAAQDVSTVQKIPGVGKKTASRIVLELKDALGSGEIGGLFAAPGSASSSHDATLEALLSMGFTQTEAELALKDAPDGSSESELLRYALKRLGE